MTDAAAIIRELAARGLSIAVAESLTGGKLLDALISVPGASDVVRGGVVAYATPIKHTLLGVDSDLQAQHGPVHTEVAAQMARGVRELFSIDGVPADLGISTTGVAGPGAQGVHPAGQAFIAIASARETSVVSVQLGGDRQAIRSGVVSESLSALSGRLAAWTSISSA